MEKRERLAGLCSQAKNSEYISRPTAQAYLETAVFEKRGLSVAYFDHSGLMNTPSFGASSSTV